MNAVYLNMVRIYLQQELPEIYREHIKLTDERLIISIADTASFSQAYETLQEAITVCIDRIRNREIDLEFTIQSTIQRRDFKILK
jgi:hypothetical protein